MKVFEKNACDKSLIVESENLRVENGMLRHENEKILKKSSDIQEKLKSKIFYLEQKFQRCQVQSINFELALQHKIEKQSFENPWMSKLEQVDNENVSMKCQISEYEKEIGHLKQVYKNLFDSIKSSRVQKQNSNLKQKETEDLKSQLNEFADKKFENVL